MEDKFIFPDMNISPPSTKSYNQSDFFFLNEEIVTGSDFKWEYPNFNFLNKKENVISSFEKLEKFGENNSKLNTYMCTQENKQTLCLRKDVINK